VPHLSPILRKVGTTKSKALNRKDRRVKAAKVAENKGWPIGGFSGFELKNP
jgi:hypothetical protein